MHRVAARRGQCLFAHGEAQIGAAVFLQDQAGIATLEQVKLDRIADQAGQAWMRCQSNA